MGWKECGILEEDRAKAIREQEQRALLRETKRAKR